MPKSLRHIPSRHRVLLLAAFLFLALFVVARPVVAASPSPFNWKQFQGTTLHVLLSDSHWQAIIMKYLPEFEELTGIRLATEVYTQAKLWDVLENGLAEPGRVDAFMTLPGLDGLRYLRLGRIQPVNDYLRDQAITAPDYNWEDFYPRARTAMEIEGAILGPPVMGEYLALLYRKDVFKAHQIEVPRTLDELEAAARALNGKPMSPNGAAGFGVVSRGKGVAATSLYAAFLSALGGTWLDQQGHSTINGPKSLAALERLGHLLRYAPPNISEFSWQEASDLFTEGKAAMYIEGASVYPLIEQSRKSLVMGKVGYAVFPSGPGGPGTTIAVRGLAIARQSANPKAAWLFLQWASSKELVRRAIIQDVFVGRQSAWRDKSLTAEFPADLVQSFEEAGRIATPNWAPPLVAVTSAREVVGKVITAAIRGENVQEAADAAEKRLTEILKQTEGR